MGDLADLVQLERRAAEGRVRYEAARARVQELQVQIQAEADRDDPSGGIRTIMSEALVELKTALDEAIAAKTALDDAYRAQEILRPPAPPAFTSEIDKTAWIERLRGDAFRAEVELEEARAALQGLPELPDFAAMPDDEVLDEMKRFGPIEDERIDLILKMGDAEARFDAAKAALDAIGEDLVGGFPDRERSDD